MKPEASKIKPRVVFDTNIYISAFLTQGKPLELLRLAGGRDAKIEVYASVEIMKETARVLSRPKFSWPAAKVKKAIVYISSMAIVVDPVERINAVVADEADNRILECAVAADAEFIVSGDRHLLGLHEFRGIRIVTPAKFLEAIG